MIKAIFFIIRPLNVLIAMASVYVGGIISSNLYYEPALLLAIISAGAICGYGNVINDIFDINIDRRNKSSRPLASGKMKTREAIFLAMILISAGIIVAGLINSLCLLIASFSAIVLLAYTPIFKTRGYLGNLVIALVASFAFFYGGAAVGAAEHGLVPAIFAFLFHLGREVIKDMEDFKADQEAGVNTGAVKFGPGVSRTVAATSLFLLIAGTIVPFGIELYGQAYLIVVVLGVDVFIAFIIFRLILKSSPGTYRLASLIMKAIMPIGLIAIFLGSRGY